MKKRKLKDHTEILLLYVVITIAVNTAKIRSTMGREYVAFMVSVMALMWIILIGLLNLFGSMYGSTKKAWILTTVLYIAAMALVILGLSSFYSALF